ncbi:MAG: extracellular solute-binding protein [Acetobacteraceae bacterium]|nr:extracellular solute-binding protein [Acetobacteraceae bacterium]
MIRALAVVIGLVLALPAAAERELTVVGFGGGFQDAARRALFRPFAAATGIAVQDETYNGEMARIYAMVRNRDVVWDVVMVEAPELARGCEDGVFAKIDWAMMGRDRFIPAGVQECGAGAVAWGAAVFWDSARTPHGPRSFAEFFDLQRFPGKRAMRSGPKMTLEIALMADGVAREDVYRVLATREGQDRAFAVLDRVRPSLVFWRAGAQPLQLVASGEVAYATGYTGRVVQAKAQGAKLAMTWDTLLYSVDYWAAVADGPRLADAMRMIRWMTGLEPLLELAKIWPASPAHRAFSERPDLRAANPDSVATNAAHGLFIDTEFWIEHGEDLEKRFAAWAAR